MTNCPNCGAVITGPKCEYCRTVFKNPYVDRGRLALLEAKTIVLRNVESTKELYLRALAAMREYAG